MVLARIRALALAVGLLVLLAPGEARPSDAVARIGLVAIGTPEDTSPRFEAFRQALRDLGYQEGRNVTIESRWAEGHAQRFRDAVAKLVASKVDVIVATSTPAALAALDVTRAVPIVFVTAADPVGSGLVASIARPGGNVTGISLLAPEMVARQVQLLKEAVPKASRVVVLSNPTNPYDATMVREVEAAARSLAMRTRVLSVSAPKDVDPALSAVVSQRPDALFVLFDPMMFSQRTRIAEFATRHRVPLMAPHREYVEAGGLMAYGVDLRENYQRAAVYVDKILKGAKPAELPVEQPTKFELVINLKTAAAIGLTIPGTLRQRADDVLE
jgi:putative ABC transport system substrate-binding protein